VLKITGLTGSLLGVIGRSFLKLATLERFRAKWKPVRVSKNAIKQKATAPALIPSKPAGL
jgi:hypothetical protein